MIVLDTNVVSALMRPTDNPVVVDWLDRQAAGQVWLTSVSIYEIRYGLLLLGSGKRRSELTMTFEQLIYEAIEYRILPFDEKAADAAAQVSAALKVQGRNVGVPDAQIAGTVISQRCALATRNVRDFQGLDIQLLDPWTA